MKEQLDALQNLPKGTCDNTYNQKNNLVFNIDIMVTTVDNDGNTISNDDHVGNDSNCISSSDSHYILPSFKDDNNTGNAIHDPATHLVTFDNPMFTNNGDSSNYSATTAINASKSDINTTDSSYFYHKSRRWKYHKRSKPPSP